MDHAILTTLGARVRKLRLAKGWSQERLAEEAGLHRTFVGGIERGERNITLATLGRLARAFGTTPDRLIAPKDLA
jgi:transcriptional regulator with XRE-family HTH domain